MIDRNLIKLYEQCFRENWDLRALSDYGEDETFTYGEMAFEITRLHYLFHKLNVRHGDKVALIGKNNTHWCITYMAVITYGAVIVPILQDFNSNDVHHIVNHSDSVLLFAADNIWENLEGEKMGNVRCVFSLGKLRCLYHQAGVPVPKIMKSLDNEIQMHYPEGFKPGNIRYPNVPNDNVVLINYTSGTTGFSKGVMLTANNLAGNITYALDLNMHFRGCRSVSFLPLAHAYGCAFDFLSPLAAGGHVTLLGKIPSPKVLLKAFVEVRPHLVCCVPLVIEKIYKNQILPKLSQKSMRLAMAIPFVRQRVYEKIRKSLITAFGGEITELAIGGATLNYEVESFLQKIQFPFTVGYGMTECGPLISYSPWREFALQSVGKPLPVMEVKIESEDQVNIPGEILVRGENVMAGYYKNEEATCAVFDSDGWLHTGDVGTIDSNGNVYIRGRSKSMILGASGQNIYPEEIEAKLNNLPCVMESLVIEKDKKLVALVYPDYESLQAMGQEVGHLNAIMEANRKHLNKITAAYENISEIVLYPTEFEKTPKRSIKRYLYSQITTKK